MCFDAGTALRTGRHGFWAPPNGCMENVHGAISNRDSVQGLWSYWGVFVGSKCLVFHLEKNELLWDQLTTDRRGDPMIISPQRLVLWVFRCCLFSCLFQVSLFGMRYSSRNYKHGRGTCHIVEERHFPRGPFPLQCFLLRVYCSMFSKAWSTTPSLAGEMSQDTRMPSVSLLRWWGCASRGLLNSGG